MADKSRRSTRHLKGVAQETIIDPTERWITICGGMDSETTERTCNAARDAVRGQPDGKWTVDCVISRCDVGAAAVLIAVSQALSPSGSLVILGASESLKARFSGRQLNQSTPPPSESST